MYLVLEFQELLQEKYTQLLESSFHWLYNAHMHRKSDLGLLYLAKFTDYHCTQLIVLVCVNDIGVFTFIVRY